MGATNAWKLDPGHTWYDALSYRVTLTPKGMALATPPVPLEPDGGAAFSLLHEVLMLFDLGDEEEDLAAKRTRLTVDQEEADDLLGRIRAFLNPQTERRCRECGCTEEDCSGCVERTGEPCYWVEADLCSACRPDQEGAAS